jgi:hypothetical protein
LWSVVIKYYRICLQYSIGNISSYLQIQYLEYSMPVFSIAAERDHDSRFSPFILCDSISEIQNNRILGERKDAHKKTFDSKVSNGTAKTKCAFYQ